jgi:iron(III) transport system ATP-binding protein
MISIRVQNLTKRFGSTVALKDLSLEIKPGELFFLLGPSGCGKTTLLRTLAGFYLPDEGQVFFDQTDVSRLEPHKRNTGMMFQSYALWPHMTVAQNVAFGLEERKTPKDETRKRVAEALGAVRMSPYADRKPNQLSGGQQQRVALARALVIRPTCLLLDEPLSNLDAQLRLEMRAEIRRVCKEFHMTTVYVTHDQKEALSVADRMAILESGKILQVGTPLEVYRKPRYKTVASFIGEIDFLAGKILAHEGARLRVQTELGEFLATCADEANAPAPGASVTVAIRPESWRFTDGATKQNAISGKISEVTYLGELAQFHFAPNAVPTHGLKVLELNPRTVSMDTNRSVTAAVDPEDVVILRD